MARDLSVKLVINGEDRTGAAFGKTRAGLESISAGLEKMRGQLNAFLALNVSSIVTRQIGEVVKTADAYKTLEARLKLVSDSQREYNIAQAEIFAIANRTRSSLESTATLYGKVETVIKQLGGTQKDALKTTETLNQAIALTSQGAANDSAAILQFSQALASGVLRGDEFNSVMENSPGLAQALADGLGVPTTKLRGMAEQGELTADRLVNALGKSAPKVAEQFAQLPVTVGGALTVLSNKFTVFIGEGDKATGSTKTLAKGILALGNNLDKVVDVGVLAAEIYGVKLVAGLGKSLQATVQSVKATREKIVVDELARQSALNALQTDRDLSNIRVKSLQATIASKREELALADTKAKSVQITRQIEVAEKKLAAARVTATASQQKLNNALFTTTAALSKSEIAFNAVNNAMSVLVAFEIGQTLGEWLRQFELTRTAGSYLAETFTLIGTGIKAMFDGLSISERFNQIKQIHADFAALRAADTNEAASQAAQTQQTEAAKTQAIEAAAVAQAASFQKVKEATAQLTTQIDADAKAQTASIQQALADKLAAIDASNASDIQKDSQRLAAKQQAAAQELQLQTQTATAKIALIDQEYAKEVASSQANKDRTQQLESEKRQAKLSVYTGLADYYQSEITRLQGVYANELQQAANANQSLQDQQRSHQQAINDINRIGLDEAQKIESLKSEFAGNQLKLKQEQQKKYADQDQDAINGYIERNKNLNSEITAAETSRAQTESQFSTVRSGALEREDKLNASIVKNKKDEVQAHKDNAEAAKQDLDATLPRLEALNTVITSIADQLKNDLMIKVGMDDTSLTIAQSTIAELIKPAEKVITIRTVNEGSGGFNPATGGAESAVTGPGSGEGFATGGHIRRQGALPGYGGGDTVKAMLEAGEYIVRKEAVQKYGLPLLQALNQGKLGKAMVIKRAQGGLVDNDWVKKLLEIKNQQDIAKLQAGLDISEQFGASVFNPGGDVKSYVENAVIKQARALNRDDLIPGLRKIIAATQANRGVNPGGITTTYDQSLKQAENNTAINTLRKDMFSQLGQSASSSSGLQIPQPNLSPLAATGGNIAGPRVVTATEIKFTGKDGTSVTGQFSGADDHSKLLKILRDSGGVTV